MQRTNSFLERNHTEKLHFTKPISSLFVVYKNMFPKLESNKKIIIDF